MEAVTSCTTPCDVEKRDLKELLEAFGSAFSLEDIASAYSKARRNVDMAGEILWASHGSTSHSDTHISKDKLECASSTSSELSYELDGASAMPLEVSSDNVLQSSYGGRNTRALKSKVRPVSIGTVSGFIAKDYSRHRPVTNDYPEATKPLKIDFKALPFADIWSEEVPPSTAARKGTVHVDVEEFMYKMLGDGFQLDMNVIRKVLGLCGYDVQKSMEKLLVLSASTLEKCDDVVDLVGKRSSEKHQDLDSAGSDGARFMTKHLPESPKRDRDRFALQKEVLEALFNVPDRSEESPKRRPQVREVRRSKWRQFGKLEVEPLTDTTIEHKIVTAKSLEVARDEDEDDVNSFEVLRKAVKEYWITMKQYYEAAVDAYVKGDHARANKLREQGHFFNRKAREADEKSAQMLLEVSQGDEMSLDLRGHERKEALHLLRIHLTSFSGILAFKYLRVIVGTSDEDTTKGARKRLILKQLEKESIKWTEVDDGGAIMIRVDVINPKRLSFSKK
ncbi:putative nuclear RNA export factor SDE5 isoform X1 [Corylus avellana]|uniref:putative nuclear RNA export factor SDE5 isoform X1 n=1 Tax=Corylus avellana TaxID=13451 RepID=UPI00286B2D06|nr:putative nuclear RNA export factor SDE5 isoform X1 [Corylus avellana]XP_059443630.1 putative nuclear RNA export factor SDE5 isoform X1 [Corylus avellana]